MGIERAQQRAAYALLAPAALLITVFFALPILASLILSVTDFDIYALAAPGNARFVGVRNYADLLRTPLFWTAIGNTLYYVAVGGPLSVLVSLGAALLVNSKLTRFKPFFRAVYFTPVVTTLVAVAIIWKYLYGLHLPGLPAIDWLGDRHWAKLAIILMSVWKSFGYNMLIFVAGLQAVPQELYDAALVDGATAVQRFRHVTLPQLGPTFLFVSITTMIGYTQLFAEPYVMTQGGPLHATYSIVEYMYEQGFRWWQLGSAAAIAFVLFALILVGSLVQARFRPAETS
ncbi:MAG TPA: sugar ABC transporter permease [Gemmatimonadaceae bacterium]|jgi:multiple sugar transport system permease protein|nr:sugar ABC transporter permease [Gemmatimonadaceae bacterium]